MIAEDVPLWVLSVLCWRLAAASSPCFYLLLAYSFIIWGCCVIVLLHTGILLLYFFSYCLMPMPFTICEWKRKQGHERHWQYRRSYKSLFSFSPLLWSLLSSYLLYFVTVIYCLCVYPQKKTNHLGTLWLTKM